MKAKRIKYNGIAFEYDDFKSYEIMEDIFEVELIKDGATVAKIMVDSQTLNKL